MPYYITDDAEGCDGWATIKEDGEVMGCHATKQEAIEQGIAIALAEESEFYGERSLEDRQVDLTVPDYIRDAAAQGLEYHREGLSGDGVVDRTVREAAAMARGELTEDKTIRVSAWAARHEADLDAEGARPDEDGYPTPGAVAHLLWGIPTGARYADARAWFDRKAAQIREEEGRMTMTPVKPRTEGSGTEFRSITCEIRADEDSRMIVGYAAKFNVPSQPLPFIERIAPGAFSRTLRNRKQDVRLFVNHDMNMPLASTRSGTLRLEEDEVGLRMEAEIVDTSYGQDLLKLMRAGVVDKMSFGFQVARKGDSWSEDGSERTLNQVILHEVSVVTGFPAYEQTQAAVRSLEALSARTGLAVEELSEALDALAEGAELDPAKADLLISAIKGATPTPEPAPVNLLGLKSKQMELLAKKVF